MISITRRYRFSASHRLHTAELSGAENAQLYGKCNNPFGHGHDYILEVTATGPVNAASGLILPIAKLDRLVDEQVLRMFASRNINLDVPQFQALVPTTENIAGVIAQLIQGAWDSYIGDPAVNLIRVHVQETDRNGFEILTPQNDFQSESAHVHA
ncbi:MAG: 6-carboxytetrahydropterin synthase [Acidobacteriota bacterium]|nr:6-carboxytetrahydropterin synthase [Acidobacteriota bacterium]